ncbi:Uncharacterized protein TCM_005072 [Theobroma cacao]|uniref:Reverse transcriptase zinc-binding domain-containing protein n=1 Tax=Theobroma cacao TaxID=3641 RepID=A0A061DSB5_THECC|nr:Uncharacterized protein TCM_005072 [Theobroma cacao]
MELTSSDASQIWELKMAGVERGRILWFHYNIPKHAMIAWMAILNNLPTLSKLSTLENPNCKQSFLWMERSSRIHGKLAQDVDALSNYSVSSVKIQIPRLLTGGYR